MNEFLSPRIKSEGFRYDGSGGTACYLIHGFTGSTFELDDFGRFLAANGIIAVADILPGHGTSPHDCNTKTQEDWIETVMSGSAALAEEFEDVFVAGFSMGTSLGIHVASRFDLSGLILYSPVIFKFKSWTAYLSHTTKWFKDYEPKTKVYKKDMPRPFFGYEVYPLRAASEVLKLTKRARHLLNEISCPAVIMHSKSDTTAPYINGPMVYDAIGSADKQFFSFEESSHVLTYDCEREKVWDISLQFMREHPRLLKDEIPIPE